MSLQFTAESFDSLYNDWSKFQAKLPASHIFSTPEWSEVWWQHFRSGATLYLKAARKAGGISGIAPLRINNTSALFIGDANVCDYLDFIVEPGEEHNFFKLLLDDLAISGIRQLELLPVRENSTVVTNLGKIAQQKGMSFLCNKVDISLELFLPATWEEYLQLLTSKQRHELNRKWRRLEESGDVKFRTSIDANVDDINVFIKLFRESRQDKADFLTPAMELFFRSLLIAMAKVKRLRLNILELNTLPVAVTICLDYKDVVYLYNSGYDPKSSWLSVGLISKAMCIQDSIRRGKKCFDFLKGGEQYKYHLGGREIPLYTCSLSF
jgi:CelD/BcsL family acetyltransferase involved in cellulose biosynthesis